MAKRDPSSNSDPETPVTSCSEEEEEEETENEEASSRNAQAKQGMSDYEKQRLERIAANRAKLQALGLPKIASSLMGSSMAKMEKSRKRKGKSKVAEDDEDYKPNYDDVENGAEDDDIDDDEFQGSKSHSKSRGKKVKNKSPKYMQKVKALKHLSDMAYDDNDDDLMQAIAISLQESGSASGSMHHSGPARSSDARVLDVTPNKRKGNACKEEDTGKRRRKKLFSSRVKMTEDELVIHFFQFDEVGTGSLGIRDLRRVAAAHDFTWTDDELAMMINCFDSNGDGKLNLDDFRKVASRCKMIEGPEDS